MMSIKDITIVITSFKSSAIIRNCLSSIDSEYKVVIVENSNDFDFKKKIEQEYTNVECILTGENLGYGKANNIGLQNVKSKYALILNPDTTLKSDSIDNFFKAIKKVSAFAIMAPFVQEKKDEIKKTGKFDNQPILVKNVKGFAMFLNISEFKEIGFFDENFFFFFEEIDLCKRLINHNKKIYLDSSIVVNHIGGKSHDKVLNQEMVLSRNWHWMWSTFYYHRKYKGFFISFLIVLPKVCSDAFKVILYSLFLNKEKRKIYICRFSGLFNAIIGKSSWYRPKV